jgi:hypothetical protein
MRRICRALSIPLPQLPNLRSNPRLPFLWTSVPCVEPPNKLLMHDAVHIVGRFAGSESDQDGTSLRFVFIGILVLKRDSNRIVPKEELLERGTWIEPATSSLGSCRHSVGQRRISGAESGTSGAY